MRNVLIALGLLLGTSAFAAGKAPMGQGNFRRAEVIKAAGAKNVSSTFVRGAALASGFVQGAKMPKGSRIMLVEHKVGDQLKVTAVKAPLDLNQAPSKMSTRQIHNAGLITQAEAKALATKNAGMLGGKGKVKLVERGLSQRGSYDFKQTAPSSLVRNVWGGKYRLSDIRRTVTLTGTGESARSYKSTSLGKTQS